MPKNFVSSKDESARLFKSDFLEMFTHVHWSVPIIIYLPVVVFFLVRTIQNPVISAGNAFGLFVAGLFFWTLTEYLLHRFLFHYEPTSAIGKRIHFLTHGVHHDYPNDSKRLVMPPVVSVPLALLFFFLFLAIFGENYLAPAFAGFIFGYILYDEIHYATHHAPMKGGLALMLKHHHILHHFQNPNRRYGVSSPLWDYVFGTMDRDEGQVPAEK